MKKPLLLSFIICIIVLLSGTAYADDNISQDDINDRTSTLYISNDVYSDNITAISFDLEDDRIPDGWYPLREISKYLQIYVYWDQESGSIIVESDVLKYSNRNLVYSSYTMDDILNRDDMIVLDGVTYCSPRFISNKIFGLGFEYNGSLYFYDINIFTFDGRVEACLFELKIKSPDDFDFIMDRLSGGIEEGTEYTDRSDVLGYVYYTSDPVCYIVRTNLFSWSLLRVIVHEAYHIELYNWGIYEQDEQVIKALANQVISKL